MSTAGGPGRLNRVPGPGGYSAGTLPTGQAFNRVGVLAVAANRVVAASATTGGSCATHPGSKFS